MKDKDEVIAEMLNVMTAAIESGDWKVDGAGDPSQAMDSAEYTLENLGWHRNSISGEWQK